MTSRSDTWTAFGPYVKRDPGGETIAGTRSDEMAIAWTEDDKSAARAAGKVKVTEFMQLREINDGKR